MEAGRTAEEMSRELGVSKATLYAWKAKYGGLALSEAKRLKELEDENSRLKRLVADLSLDREALKKLHQNYIACGLKKRDDEIEMQKKVPGWKFKAVRW